MLFSDGLSAAKAIHRRLTISPHVTYGSDVTLRTLSTKSVFCMQQISYTMVYCVHCYFRRRKLLFSVMIRRVNSSDMNFMEEKVLRRCPGFITCQESHTQEGSLILSLSLSISPPVSVLLWVNMSVSQDHYCHSRVLYLLLSLYLSLCFPHPIISATHAFCLSDPVSVCLAPVSLSLCVNNGVCLLVSLRPCLLLSLGLCLSLSLSLSLCVSLLACLPLSLSLCQLVSVSLFLSLSLPLSLMVIHCPCLSR